MIEDAVRALLVADATVAAAVGDRVRPDVLDESDDPPAIIIDVPKDSELEGLGGPLGTVIAQVAVVCQAATKPAARRLERDARDALVAHEGPVAGVAGLSIQEVRHLDTVTDYFDDEDGSDDGVFEATGLYEITYDLT